MRVAHEKQKARCPQGKRTALMGASMQTMQALEEEEEEEEGGADLEEEESAEKEKKERRRSLTTRSSLHNNSFIMLTWRGVGWGPM